MRRHTPEALLGAACAPAIVNLLNKGFSTNPLGFLPELVGAAAVAFLVLGLVVPGTWRWLGGLPFGVRALVVAGSALLGCGALAAIPVSTANVVQWRWIHLQATGTAEPVSRGTRVALLRIDVDGGRYAPPLAELTRGDAWTLRDGALEASRVPASLWLRLPVRDYVTLTFRSGDDAGIVAIDFLGRTRPTSLYSSFPERSVLLSVPPALSRRAVVIGLSYLLLGTLGMLIVVGALARAPGGAGAADGVGRPGQRPDPVLVLALVPAVAWGLLLMAFYPGLMTWDSFAQWREMLTFSFDGIHPPFHTLFNWLITRAWLSPAAVALAQIVVGALVVAWVVRVLERAGVSRGVARGVLLFVALAPAYGMLTITLWKDVPYSIAVLALTGVMVQVAVTRGAWLRRVPHALLLAVLLVLVTMFRLNGAATALVVLGGLLVLTGPRRAAAAAGAICLLVVATILGPLYDAVGVHRVVNLSGYAMPIQQIGAFLHEGRDLPEKDEAYLADLMPLRLWRALYYPYNHSPLLAAPEFQAPALAQDQRGLVTAWWHAWTRAPGTAWRAWVAQSSILWRVTEAPNAYTFTVPRTIDENDLGLHSASRLPALRSLANRVLDATERPGGLWMFWRPGLYLLLSVLAAFVLSLRGGAVWWVVTLPQLGNLAGLLPTVGSQEVRFMFPTLLTAPFVVALLARNPARAGGRADTPARAAVTGEPGPSSAGGSGDDLRQDGEHHLRGEPGEDGGPGGAT